MTAVPFPPPIHPERTEDQIPEESNQSSHSETDTSSDSTPDDLPQTCSVDGVAKSGSAASIYLDNGMSEDPKPSKPPQPQKRLTMVSSMVMSGSFFKLPAPMDKT